MSRASMKPFREETKDWSQAEVAGRVGSSSWQIWISSLDRKQPVNVIIASDVEGIHEAVSRGDQGLVAGGSGRARGIFFVANLDQLFCQLVTVKIKLIGNLVADTVENNARMVAVAAQHGPQIRVVPLLQLKMITVGRFAARVLREIVRPVPVPLVKSFIKDIETHLVAQVVKLGRERVMAGANGIAAHLLQSGEAQGPDGRRHGIAK